MKKSFFNTQMMFVLIAVMMFTIAIADVNTGSCKDMLQGYLTGQLSSALGTYQVEDMSIVTNNITISLNILTNIIQLSLIIDKYYF